MSLRRLIEKSMVTLLALGLVACSTSGNNNETNGSSSYKIGLHFELTGAVADYGNSEINGAKLAIKLANEKLGEEKYSYVEYDNKSSTSDAVTIATTLAGEDIIGVVGPATSGASAATYQVMDGAGIPVISPSATQNNITLKNPDDSNSEVYENVFRVCFEDSYQGAAMAQFAYDKLGASKVVVFGDSSSDYTKGVLEAFSNQFAKIGGTVVDTQYYVSGDTDFAAVLTNFKSMDFDALFVAGYYQEAGLIIKQAREMGIDKTILGGDGFDSPTLASLAGASNLNNVYFTTAYTTVNASEQLQAFIDAYKAEYNEDPSMFSALAFDATNTLIEASEKAGNDRNAIREAIKNINFSGITGDFTFDEKHTPIKTVLVVSLVDGVQSNAETVAPK